MKMTSINRLVRNVLSWRNISIWKDELHKSSPHLEQTKLNILRETEISREHLTPEIALYLITPACRLYSAPIIPEEERVFRNDPFWGFYWPGGQAVSKYILDNPSLVAGRSILDVGSGCGASSLAALLSGAKYAVANDVDEAAGVATLLNAALNNVPIDSLHISSENMIGRSKIEEEIIFLGDIFYDEEIASTLLPWLHHMRRRNKLILIGDPGRHVLTENRRRDLLQLLASYELPRNSCLENNGFRCASVWRFK